MQSVCIFYKKNESGLDAIDNVEFISPEHNREEVSKKAAEYNAKHGIYQVKVIDDPLIEAAFNKIHPLDPPYRQPKDLIDDIENVQNELSNCIADITAELELILDRLNETPTQEATK